MEPPAWVKNKASWIKQRRRLVARAKELIEGHVSVLQSARNIVKYCVYFRAMEDPDFIIFKAILSDTGHLPLGEVRKHWAQEALEKEDTKIRVVETTMRPAAIKAAQNLIKKYGKDSD